MSNESNSITRTEDHKTQILMSGAGGLIGTALVEHLTKHGYRIRPLVRRPARPGEVSWDPARGQLNASDLDGVQAVVHLSGENIGARWTRARKARIRSSRLQGTRLLSEALRRLRTPPDVMVSASAVGIYGNRGDEILTEDSLAGDTSHDFLAELVRDWEAAADPARDAGVRVVHPRFGVALSRRGGALAKLLPLFRLGLGGPLGNGLQWMSWVSIDDLVAAVLHLIRTGTMSGPVNVTAPDPARNLDFTRVLGRVLRRPTILTLPPAALRLVLGEMVDSTLLASTRAVPVRLLASGFQFHEPDLETALRHVLRQ